MLKDHANKHQVIAGGSDKPSLADADTLTEPAGVSLTTTLAMVRGSHMRLRMVLITLFGTDHLDALAMKEVNT